MLVVHDFISCIGRLGRGHSTGPRYPDFTAFILPYLGYVKNKKLRKKGGYTRYYSGNSRETPRLGVARTAS
jgi:hypothetical protein